jgi:hypothetical protein
MRSSHLGLCWLAVVSALFLRALVPSGWMPVASGDGIRIMICSGHGPVEITQPHSSHGAMARHHQAADHLGGQAHHGPAHDGGKVPHDPCPYGLALAKALDLPPPLAVIAPTEAVATPSGPAWIEVRPIARRSVRPPARAPPQPA